MQATSVRYHVRPMDLGDISQVMEIEQESFLNMWPATAFKRDIQHNPLARYLVVAEQRQDAEEAMALLAERERRRAPMPPPRLGRWVGELKRLFGVEEEGEVETSREPIVGLVGVWLMPGEAHIVTIAVRESHRGRGIAPCARATAAVASANSCSSLPSRWPPSTIGRSSPSRFAPPTRRPRPCTKSTASGRLAFATAITPTITKTP